MIPIYIDKKKFIVKESDNLLQACLSVGINIPYFCWHPALGSIGSCRQCAVTLHTDVPGSSESIIMSCMTPVKSNMHISIPDIMSTKFRKSIAELMMLNHPHDCPICSEGGSCHLQDMVVLNKHYSRRYFFKKRIFSSQFLGPFIKHEMNRCITCYRCVRYYTDYAGGKDFGVFGSNNKIYFGRLKDGVLENEYSGNLIDICPTGVFTEKPDSKPFYRKWDLQYTPSICQHCSIGCNISIGERLGKICKIDNRFHKDINKYFLCDLGRFGYGYSNSSNRLNRPYKVIDNKIKYLKYSDSISLVNNILKNNDKIIGIGSSRASIESNMALYDLVGEDNFSNGMTDRLNICIKLMIEIINNYSLYIPKISEIEDYDVIIIISEDITQTASRAALAVRQAITKSININIAKKYNVPAWNTNALKNIKQNNKNLLFILSSNYSKLDDISTWSYYASIDDQIKFGEKILKNIYKSPNIKDISSDLVSFRARDIASALSNAKKPLIITGSSSEDINIIKISTNIALALKKINPPVGILLFPPVSNSFGVASTSNLSLENTFHKIKKNNINTIFILENNLYRYYSVKFLNKILKNIKNIIVLDHQNNHIVRKANIVFSCANSIESSGTTVNYEMRAQRFFKAYLPHFYNKNYLVLESWKWLRAIKKNISSIKTLNLFLIDNMINICIKKKSIFKNLHKTAPTSKFTVIGQKIARSPHRYTGRTSLYCKENIHEPMSPKDLDTCYSYSMEGAQVKENSNIPKPFTWYPGWNSIQFVHRLSENKLIEENASFQGIFLHEKKKLKDISFLIIHNDQDIRIKKPGFKIVLNSALLGSEEMSQEYFKKYEFYNNFYIIINIEHANTLNISDGDYVSFVCEDIFYRLPISVSNTLPKNLISLPLGRYNLPFSLISQYITNLKKG